MIYHGRTLTTSVPFSVVIAAISTHAFVASQYPLILSVEIHCGIEGQEVIAECLRRILGDRLVTGLLDGDDGGDNDLPSPERLRGSILLKVRLSVP